MKKNHRGKVIENIQIAQDVYKLRFKGGVETVEPGQFVSILIPNKTLRRPFSVAGFKDGEITVLYKLKGEGTNYLKTLKENDEINFLCPLGNTFDTKKASRVLLVGAGIGIAPMLFLKERLKESFLITGFKTEAEVIQGSDKTVIGGSVLDNIDEIIKSYKPDLICSCGPLIVLKLLSEIGEKYGIETQVAMEKTMACGIGVCRGCIIKLKSGNASVCKDGPVFRGDEILW